MIRAVRVLHEKIKTAQGLVVELKVWRVPKSEDYPEGFKYSFYAVFGKQVLVGYDNHKPKGHHRHFEGEESVYEFSTLEKLREDFQRDLKEARKKLGVKHGT